MNLLRSLLKKLTLPWQVVRFTVLILVVCLLPPVEAGAATNVNYNVFCVTGGDCALYDPTACNNAGDSTPAPTPSSSASKIYMLGDSIMVGAYYEPDTPLKQDMDAKSWSSQADASGGRALTYPGTDPRGSLPGKNQDGLDAIKSDSDAIKASDTVVIELGTNESGSAADFKNQMEQAIAEVKNINSSATIYWVNLFSNVTSFTPLIKEYNQTITSVASDKNIGVIDTTKANVSLSPDGIHPDAAGYKTLSKTITDAIDQGSASASASGTVSGTGTQPTIVVDPGHSGTDNPVTDPSTGLYDHDYPNPPETGEVFTVATKVRDQLENDGYKVIMTKNSVNDTVTFRQRADIANNANADLALSIHDTHDTSWEDMGGGDGGQVYVQQVGDYRQNKPGQGRGTAKVTFTDASVAQKSQQYGQIFAQQRTQDENHKVEVAPISFDSRPDLPSGNIPMVMLFSKVPWVYNEVGAGTADLTNQQINEYAQGLVDGVEQSIPTTGSTGNTPDLSGTCTCTASIDNADASLPGNDNEEKIWNYFKKLGLNDKQTAGVVGNIADETGSTFDPQIVEGGGRSKTQPKTGGADGWGLVQWTYPYQDVDKLINQYSINGKAYTLPTQLDLISAQMSGTSPTGVNNMIQGLKGINDVTQAATYFSDNFEGGVPGSRVADAIDAYNKYKGTDPSAPGGGGPGAGGGSTGSGSTVTSDTLNGHTLPATTGYTGDESFFSTYALGSPANQAENDYYITMRWRYQKWNWDGTSVAGPESVDFYLKHPRVLVTNPRNHKSIIADALESGPAPWTGVDTGPNNDPKQGWTNPQDGTPPQYKGRVSGFPPPGITALGAIQGMSSGATGDKLLYAWAPDQNAKLGPTDLSVTSIASAVGSPSCQSTGSGNNASIVQIAKQEEALHLVGTGPLNDGGPVCKYQGSTCPQAWCADFVSWVYKQAGAPFTGGADGGWRLALASDITGYFLDRKDQPNIGYGTPSGGDPMEPGWAVSFTGADPGKRGIGHVGIVVAVNGNTFDYIDGNGAGPGVTLNKNVPMSSAIDWGGYK